MGLRKKKTLLEQAEGYVEAAIDQAKEFVQDTARPALADARDKVHRINARAATLAEQRRGKDKAAPVVAAGAAAVAAKAAEAKGLAEAKAAELSGSQPKKRSKIKTLLMLGAVGGAVAVVAKRLQSSSGDGGGWQTSYDPAPPPSPAASVPPPPPVESVPDPRAGRRVPVEPDPLTDPLPEVEESSKKSSVAGG